MASHVLRAYVALQTLLNLVDAKSLFYTSPANEENIISSAIPLGNGRLGASPLGTYGKETIILNLDSLWSGGPFENSDYRGGNPESSKADALADIRKTIFSDGAGNVDALLGNSKNYGSYQVFGSLTIDLDLANLPKASNFSMGLNLETGIYTSQWKNGDVKFFREAFCSYPDQVCVYHVTSSSPLPAAKIALSDERTDPASQISCQDSSINLRGRTADPDGMIYDGRATVSGSSCSDNKLAVAAGEKEFFIVFAAGTNYDLEKGNKESGFSFKGSDPAEAVKQNATAAASKSYEELKKSHTDDFLNLMGRFTLDIPDSKGSADKTTKEIIDGYTQQGGDPFVESLLFDYGRYLSVSSSRPGSLPSNLQGIWNEKMDPSWSADYHANINLQMNYWTADQTGLGDQTEPLWTYMAKTWVPRGEETAKLLYGGEGWVTHNEMNIFGHTAMKEAAGWANYPVTNAWMALHVWDHFDYSQDAEWYESIGYPLLKGVGQFWLSQLQEDTRSNDGTFVVNPCNSPEQGPTTFGCTHYQQLIFELFHHILRGWDLSGDQDTAFKSKVQDMLSKLDPGVHVGKSGEIQEWKADDGSWSSPHHRHLSNLVGWYPGFSIASVHADNDTVISAVEATLNSRGDGSDDSNTGWGKVWRSACWARKSDTDKAYSHLKLAIQENFAQNGLSMYGGQPPFQIDANFGLSAAVLAMLVQDLDRAHDDDSGQEVVLGPAIPPGWGEGSVSGMRLRGGGSVNFSWDGNGKVTACTHDGAGRGNGAPKLSFSVKGGNMIEC